MTVLKNKYFLLLIVFLLMLVDGQISYFLSSLFSYKVTITSHLSLLACLYFFREKKGTFIFTSAIILGLIFDSYYLNTIGIAILLLPFIIFFTSKLAETIFEGSFQVLTVYIIVLFLYETGGYLLSWFYGMTTLSLPHFITYSFAPTLVYNVVIYFVFYKILKLIFFEG